MSSKTSKAPAAKRKSPAEKAREARARAAKEKAAQEPPATPTPDTSADTPKTGNTAMTVSELAEAYLKALEAAGRSRGCVFSYSIDIGLAVRYFGEKAKVAALTEQKVIKFFESDLVTKTRTGKPKARPTIDKTRRVLRQALLWAAEQRIIDAAPIPAKYARRQRKTATTA